MDCSWVNYDRPQFATARRKSYGYLVRGSYPQMNELFRCFSSFFFKCMNYIRIHPDRCPLSTMWLSRRNRVGTTCTFWTANGLGRVNVWWLKRFWTQVAIKLMGPDVDGGCAKHRQVSWFCWKWLFFTWVNRQSESSMQADFPFFLGDSSRTKEFEIMKGVCHPNLVQALDYFQHPCGSALVLSYIPSVTLTAAVRSTTHKHTTSTTFLSEGKAKTLFRMLLDALSYLHHRRIIHSDAWCIEMLKGSERPFCTLKLTYESEVYTRRHFRVWVQ